MLNQEFNESIGKIENEVKRLGRIDFRLNNELTQKPYLYIDKVKEALDKEQKEIVKIIKSNNEKYVTKISHIDNKVSRVLTDTESLIF